MVSVRCSVGVGLAEWRRRLSHAPVCRSHISVSGFQRGVVGAGEHALGGGGVPPAVTVVGFVVDLVERSRECPYRAPSDRLDGRAEAAASPLCSETPTISLYRACARPITQ